MPTPKKCGSKSKCRKPCGPKSCGSAKGGCKSNTDMFDGFLSDFVANKTTVLVLMSAALGLGALFSMMLGVSAAGL
ncbi:MAG: hypothetical protein ACOYUZ_06400 [Patescibacteria group bacterium]